MFNPFTDYTITDDWDAHVARNGFGGGVDWAMPVGTPILCPDYARVEYIPNNGTGGHTTKAIYERGNYDVFMHNSDFLPGNYVRGPGESIALSGGAKGAPGAGNSTGPHVHSHGIDERGNRVRPFFLNSPPFPTSKTTSLTEMDNEMKLIREPDFGRIALIGGASGATILGPESALPALSLAGLVAVCGPVINMETEGYWLATVAQAKRTAVAGTAGGTPTIDYPLLAKALKDIGAFDLVIAGTARPYPATQ